MTATSEFEANTNLISALRVDQLNLGGTDGIHRVRGASATLMNARMFVGLDRKDRDGYDYE